MAHLAGAEVTVIDKDSHLLKETFRTEACQVIEADLHREDMVGVADELTRNGPVELVVNNVGITTPPVAGDRPPELDLVLGTNLRGPWLFTDRLVKALIEDQARAPDRIPRRRGSILFISSLHDQFVAREAHYSVSKAGVSMLVQAMAKDLGRHRIRVNAISPGWIRTAEDTSTPEQVAKRPRPRPRTRRPGRRPRRRRQGRPVPAQRRLVGLCHRPEHRRGRRAVPAQLARRVAAPGAPAPPGPGPRTPAATG